MGYLNSFSFLLISMLYLSQGISGCDITNNACNNEFTSFSNENSVRFLSYKMTKEQLETECRSMKGLNKCLTENFKGCDDSAIKEKFPNLSLYNLRGFIDSLSPLCDDVAAKADFLNSTVCVEKNQGIFQNAMTPFTNNTKALMSNPLVKDMKEQLDKLKRFAGGLMTDEMKKSLAEAEVKLTEALKPICCGLFDSFDEIGNELEKKCGPRSRLFKDNFASTDQANECNILKEECSSAMAMFASATMVIVLAVLSATQKLY